MLKTAITIFCAATLASPIYAETPPVCMGTAKLEAGLVDWHNETPSSQLGDDIVLWTASQGGTWTIVQHVGNGTSCTIDFGVNWAANHYDRDIKAK